MQQDLKAAVNTGLLFISTFGGVNAVMFEPDNNKLQLPSPYISDKENTIALQAFQAAKDRTACFLQDCCQIRYCILKMEDMAALIGPFRSEKHPSNEVIEPLFKLKTQRD